MADVLLRGMDMPEYCYDCPCHNGESGYCQAYKSGYLYSIERPAKCPLVHLPEGHGRLIDADRLKLVLEKNFGSLGGAAVLGQMIDFAPTIVPAEGGSADG